MRRGRLGLRFAAHDPALVVALAPGGAAERAGVRVGDELSRAVDLSRCRAGVSVILPLRRGDLTVTPDPWPEERYDGLDVSYGFVRHGDVALRTIAVAPRGGSARLVVYAQGHDLGSVERSTAGADDPLRGMVTSLARAGYAVLRVERRGVGDSDGDDPRGTDWATERADLLAALRGTDATDIVLLGHSLGAMHAAALAVMDPRVRAVVAYGGGADPWRAYLDANLRRQLALAGEPDAEDIARSLAAFHDAVLDGAAVPEAVAPLSVRARVWSGADLRGGLHGRALAYWRAVDREDPAVALRALKVPTLALWGESDFLTTREEHARLAELAGGDLATVPGADHGFAAFSDARASFAARGVGPWAPRVGDALRRWLDGVFGGPLRG
jgi:pimeloyl-ACP methyl ester carboxylesterase